MFYFRYNLWKQSSLHFAPTGNKNHATSSQDQNATQLQDNLRKLASTDYAQAHTAYKLPVDKRLKL